jgi:hypothetical protein
MSNEYVSDPDYEKEDETINVEDLFLIYHQTSNYTTNELYKLGFIVNKKTLKKFIGKLL